MVVANCNASCYWLHVHCSQWQLLLFLLNRIEGWFCHHGRLYAVRFETASRDTQTLNFSRNLSKVYARRVVSDDRAANPKFVLTALFNNTRTLKLKAQLTSAFFAAVNQVFRRSSQLMTTAELCSLSELCTMIWSLLVRQPANIWLTVANNAFVGCALNFRVCKLLKGTVKSTSSLLFGATSYYHSRWKIGNRDSEGESFCIEY